MTTALLILVLFATLVGALVVFGSLRARRYVLPRPYDEVHHATTADGWRLALHRYRGDGSADEGSADEGSADEGSAKRPPVLFCHGVGANRQNVDLDDEHSMARFVAAGGRDVWLLDLRGVGASDRADARAGREPGWTFDDHVRLDAPAALACVAAATGASEVDWVGFSMGGLIAYAWFGTLAGQTAGGAPPAPGDAGRSPAAPLPSLRRLVTVGSPVMTRPGGKLGVLGAAGALLRPFRRTPLEGPARAFAFAAGPLYRLAGGVIGVRGGTATPTLRRAMAMVVGDISRGVSRQFHDWISRGRFTSTNGALDYAAGMARITAPALLVGGAADRLAPPHSVEAAFARLGATEKRLVVLGPEHGQRQAYGHADLAFGRHAREEVYPRVRDWLEGSDASDGTQAASR